MVYKILSRIFIGFLLAILFAPLANARFPSNSALYFRPSVDGSRYFSVEEAPGLYQWGYNFSLNVNYAFEPVELVVSGTTSRVAGVIDDLLVAHMTTAVGLTDWLTVGLDTPVAAYETFYNFVNNDTSFCQANAVCPKQTKTKLGDVMLTAKFTLVDSNRGPVGIAIQPFMMFPTGSGYYGTGYGQFSGGGKVIFDANFNRKLFLALNFGYQVLKERRYAPKTTNATINDQILISGAINIPLGRDWATLHEIFGETLIQSPFQYAVQSPFEYLGGVRYSPGLIKRWSFTLAGGAGLDKGYGASKFRGLFQVNYRKANVVELEEEVVTSPFEEKIIITQKIHFEFDRWNIREISFPILDDVAEVLNRNPQITLVRIEGHTDSIGSDAYNQKLSERRAASVKKYLVGKGIDANRLTTVGYGESRPIADNNTTLGRAKNRRTEFTVEQSR